MGLCEEASVIRVGFGATVWAACTRAGHLDGIGVYTKALWCELQQLAETEHEALVLEPYAFGRDFPIMECGSPVALGREFAPHALSLSLFGKSFGLSSLYKEIDVFHATDHYIPLVPSVPVVATVMDVIPFLHPEWTSRRFRNLKNFLFEKSIRSAQHIITISEYSKSDIVNLFDIDPASISVTPLGVDQVYFSRALPEVKAAVLLKYSLLADFFLFVGTLQPRKNLQRVISAFKALPPEIRAVHRLVVVGRDGWGSDDVLFELQALERSGEAVWLKYLPRAEVLALLQSAAALVFPSLYEGFGLPVLEAFASQCPVITSNTTSLPEVAGESAWLVDPLSVDEISHAMLNILSRDEITQARIISGYERALSFSWKSCAFSTLQVYRNLR